MFKKVIFGILTIGMLTGSTCDPQVMEDVLNTVIGTTITEQEAANGLKEALVQGATNGSDLLSVVNGYLGNPQVKIPFPPEAQKIESTLRNLGLNKMCDDVVNSVNHAAENAAIEAKAVLTNSIRQMTIADAMNILFGANDAATEYLKKTTTAELTAKFTPIVQSSLNKVGATKYWTDAINYYNKIPLVEDMNPDLTGYVTQKALDGLFLMIEKEELKIRQDPGARVADIVQKVFAYYDANK
ncbi:MAG: DUF4197 domain-containing protein [Chitinophagales bacterium]|jgi:hypothetical protein|nr:DUF4197 domain-containing protein [Bacteroidota bacterium]MBK7569398.1 DUF4197 domain-containing protein [Bacteroidota bacterium]MBP8916207.1 DUF4197 domain-containing protein [Chitinophagales bacterium]MBP9219872.1 DUF4197 domain-containing protein [Chitinophagales bacterium]MBP9794461.1 DUF4197 domain-containing protein [Chitinophagales bacterium]